MTITPSYINGEWITSNATQHTPVYNPSTGEILSQTPHSSRQEIDQAVQSAKNAFIGWSTTPVLKRATVLFRYKALLEEHFSKLVGLVVKENGKTLPEAKGDVRRGIEVVDFACGIPHLIKGETLPQIASTMDGASTYEPLGVCAGITPFNFPAMVPMWMFPLAIACGNTFVLKPSEKTPLTANRLAELAKEAGLPDRVLNVVQGAREAVDALCEHPDISAISFVGSTRVAKHVYTTGTSHGKRVQSAGGAKNVMIVMPDADPESTVRAIAGAAFGCAGQRCMAGSVVLGLEQAGQGIVDRLSDMADKFKILPTDSNPDSDMGPVIDGAARERLLNTIENLAGQGAQLASDGRRGLPNSGFFVGPTIVDHVTPDMNLARDEVFGPILSVGRPESLDEAIEWMSLSGYGNGAVIFTSNGGAAREIARKAPCGMIGVNVGVPAAISQFAFSGWNQSFFGDLHVQGMEGVRFYTRQKVVFSRWDSNYVRKLGW
ncbi:MAG: CoA-acylating methylmalonate-semialdehyde dehydrogenase [Opitutales bacterium]|nr:CoA-acylating methylmalonate-semialdehyde dehydrogenase [Opitutales bacterium]